MSLRVAKRRRLASDESGAILIAGIFVSAFLVGALYMLIGASTAMQHGERMQDGADSAAFSAAQMHAKGMNLIALNNMVKVSALATASALPSVALGAEDTINWIRSGYFRYLAFGWNIPFLRVIQTMALHAVAESQGDLLDLISASDQAQNALIRDLPLISERVINQMRPSFSPPVTTFFLSPVRQMPVEEESMLVTCARIAPFALSIAREAFKLVPLGFLGRMGIGFSMSYVPGFCLAFGKPTMVPSEVHGTEAYQIRAFAGGEPLSELGEKGAQVATWGAPGVTTISTIRDSLTRISFAQAEYYYSGSTIEAAALWSMNWRARLRRFRWPNTDLMGDCARGGGPLAACAALPEFFGRMRWATVH
ncbi:MAG: hypothetical protein GY811_05295 [Myxococcales bacterium]|nr:hypothetical protein [Myxococcales bacterium]